MAPKKNKGQKMGIGDFLQDASLGSTSWADEMEDAPLPAVPATSRYGASDRGYGSSAYGSTAAYTDRGYSTRPQVALPDKPPFTVHLGNLSFDATEGDISDFFHDCDVDSVRIVEDKVDSKPKGFGYAEFKSRAGIEKAIAKDGSQFQGRNIRISPAEPHRGAREISDWSRKGPLPDLPRENSRRGPDRADGFGSGDPRGQRFEPAPMMNERSSSRRGNDFGDGKPRDLGNWERKGPPTPVNPPSAPNRSFDRPASREGSALQHRAPAWGEDAGSRPPRREFTERAPPVERTVTAAEQDSQWRTKMKPDASLPNPIPEAADSTPTTTIPASRPKLNLAKRTVSEAQPQDTTSDAKASPFGAARPVDTAAKEREAEEKLQQSMKEKKELDEKRTVEDKTKEKKARDGPRGGSRKESRPPNGEPKRILPRRERSENEKKPIEAENANGIVVDDKETKPQTLVQDPGVEGDEAVASTADALQSDGWNVVKSARKGKGGNTARALAS